jgi:putative redox protein
MDANVSWKQGLSFTGKAGSGFEIPLGADPSVGGANDGSRPLELMAVSLAGCTAMDVISILRKKKQDVSAFDVAVHADQAGEYPHVFTHLVVTYLVSGHNLDEVALLRAIELSATKYCPAQAMLGKIAPMDLKYEIYEDEGGGNKRLVTQGTYQPKPA